MNCKYKNIFLDSHIFYSKRIILGLFLVVFSFPSITQASFLATVANFFISESASAQTEAIIETNSQTMALLEPANNINPTAKANLGNSNDSNEALIAEIGPTGENFNNNYSNGQISTYVVRSGDSLSKIADMFDVSVNTILWANDMNKNSVIKAGQNLVILPMSGVLHTVSSGDTLSTIAKKYGGDIDEIAIFNDLKSTDKLSVGDVIIIPDGQVSSSISPSSTNNSSAKVVSNNNTTYEGYYAKPFINGRRTQGIHGYNAVDYAMPSGSSLFAAAEGTVLIAKNAGWNGGYGQYVVIKHPNNTQTLYAHMSSVSVSVGQTVKKGQTIGSSGNSGRSTGPHLHFEIRGAKNPF